MPKSIWDIRAFSRKTAIGVLLAAAGLVILGTYYWRAAREIPVQTIAVQSNVEVRLFGIGTVEAQVLSKVGFQLAGRVIAVEADQGDLVKKGALLAKLDDAAQRAKLMKSDAALRQAAASLTRAKALGERAKAAYQQKKSVNARRQTLIARGTVSQEVADDAKAAEDIAMSDVKVSEADAAIAAVLQDDAAAQRQIDAVLVDQHEMRAPFDARIIARHKELGSVTNPGEAIFTLIAPESVWVRAYVDEALAGGLGIGQTAHVRLRSEANQVVEAEVVRVDQENDRVTEERRVYVRCRKCSPLHQLRHLGEQAEVEVVKRIIPSGLFIPLKFVEGFSGRTGTIWVIERGRLAKRRVQLGERLLDGRVQITTELPAGSDVVADDRADLREGRAARKATRGS